MGWKAKETSAPIPRDQAESSALGNSKVEPETLSDVPVQVRALARLSQKELNRYRQARRLLASGEGVQPLLQANIPIAGLGVYEAFLAQSWSVRFDDPEKMIRLAEVAVEVSQSFTARAYGKKRVADLQARAWGELANAYRAADRLRSAQQAFGTAYALRHNGTDDPYLKARLFDLEASLLGTMREFPAALHRLKSLSNLYLKLGEPYPAGRALIIRALYMYYSGETEDAILINQEGVSLIDQKLSPGLFMHALHNHLLFLVELRRYLPARRALFKSRQYLIYQDRVNAARLRWIEGRICYGLAELVSAEIAFREVKKSFAAAGMNFHAALLALERAMVLKSLNQPSEALQEVIAAREIFLSFEIYREYLGSVIFLEESFLRGEATAELIEATVAQIIRKSLQVSPARMQ
jgi:hypothetical protein